MDTKTTDISAIELFAEELPEDHNAFSDGLVVEDLHPGHALASSSLGTFTSGSSFSCPASTAGTLSTAGTVVAF